MHMQIQVAGMHTSLRAKRIFLPCGFSPARDYLALSGPNDASAALTRTMFLFSSVAGSLHWTLPGFPPGGCVACII